MYRPTPVQHSGPSRPLPAQHSVDFLGEPDKPSEVLADPQMDDDPPATPPSSESGSDSESESPKDTSEATTTEDAEGEDAEGSDTENDTEGDAEGDAEPDAESDAEGDDNQSEQDETLAALREMTRHELLDMAKGAGLTGLSQAKKEELVEAIHAALSEDSGSDSESESSGDEQ